MLTMAWAVSAAFTCELVAQKMQKVMMLLLLGAEDIEGLIFGCWCGEQGGMRAVASRMCSGRSWAGECVCRDGARARAMACVWT